MEIKRDPDGEIRGDLDDILNGDPKLLTKPIKSVEDKWRLVPAFLKVSISLLAV
jgi:hypothetical protein